MYTRVRNTDSIRVTWCCLRLVGLIFDNRINNARISNFFQQWVVHFGFIVYTVMHATRFISYSYQYCRTLYIMPKNMTPRHVLQKIVCRYDKTKSINVTINPNPTCTSKYIFLQLITGIYILYNIHQRKYILLFSLHRSPKRRKRFH